MKVDFKILLALMQALIVVEVTRMPIIKDKGYKIFGLEIIQ